MASRKTKKKEGGKQRSQRATSNVFSMFDQSQIQEFKEPPKTNLCRPTPSEIVQEIENAFTMIDANRDGFIDKEDLKDTYASLGRVLDDEEIAKMLAEGKGPINFQIFLGMYGDKISGTDPEETILAAFKVLDSDEKGVLNKNFLGEILMTQADRFDRNELNQMFSIAPIDAAGNLDYKSLCYIVTHGQEEE